ncbi:alpha/beta fold hydrolase [Desertihabitans aurantiacus]|uniref:alpha/beta fold hydrolase n=1 Tax=Desertihabitans aurantiacus TaxID=2282477 RepID=UPI0013009997|nr:alpha/beta hydrolase [Desertihabitans aurantiacus]
MTATTQTTLRTGDGGSVGYRTLGSGPGVVVVGGALRSSEDYLPLARALAGVHTVHLLDRRGRGLSSPQPAGWTLRTDAEDLRAVLEATGARAAFGHSFGGLVVLDALRAGADLDRVVLYEPALPGEPLPTGWMRPYEQHLAAGDLRAAFAEFLRGSGGAPAVVSRLPRWYLRLVLCIAFRGAGWRRLAPLLGPNLAEHREIGRQTGWAPLHTHARVLLLNGGRSAHPVGVEDLGRLVLGVETLTLPGLDHFGPEGRTAARVADAVTTRAAP